MQDFYVHLIRWCCTVCICGSLLLQPDRGYGAADPAMVQAVAGANLGAGYAQMVSVALSPDFSTAHYRIATADPGETSDTKLSNMRLPLPFKLATVAGAELFGEFDFCYLSMDTRFQLNYPTTGSGSIDSTWQSYGGSAGLIAKIPLMTSVPFTFEPSIRAGIARLDNNASYQGSAHQLETDLNNLIFNWDTYAFIVSPGVAIEYHERGESSQWLVRAETVHSRVKSFSESAPVQKFKENANVFSLKAEFNYPLGVKLAGRDMRWIALGGYTSFYGDNMAILGFSRFGEAGAGVEMMIDPKESDSRWLRFTFEILKGDSVSGWTAGLSLRR